MGIQSDYDGLNVIHVKRTGEKSVTADGVLLSDTCLPLYPGKEKVAAEVTL